MRTIFLTYRISLLNNAGEKQILSRFNGEDDLLTFVYDYTNHIHQNIKRYIDNTGNQRTFTLDGIPNLNTDGRLIHGFFDSAYTGERIKIKESETNTLLYNVGQRDLQSRSFFFLIYIPKNSQHAYLIVQKKNNHAVKGVLQNSLNEFLQMRGLMQSRIVLEHAPSYFLLNRMLELGSLKEIKLIRDSILSSFEEQFGVANGVVNSGHFEKVIRFDKNSTTLNFKTFLLQLYQNRYLENEQITVVGEAYNEVSFKLKLDNLTKTFYIKDRTQIRSNTDVTNLLQYENGEPTRDSLINVSLELINNINPPNANAA